MRSRVRYLKTILIFFMLSLLIFLLRSDLSVKHLRRHIERSLKLDKRKAPTEEIFVQNIAQEIPYLPIEDLVNTKFYERNINDSCAWYPKLTDVKIHNEYWQKFRNQDYSYFIFGAYLDNRPTVVKSELLVRVLTTIDFLAETNEEYPKTYCQFWYKEQTQPIITIMKDMTQLWNYDWGHGRELHCAHFVNCPLPKDHLDWVPKSVSLVSQPCDNATNNVRVTYQPLFSHETKKDFAVCHKALDFPGEDMSNRFVEYFETIRILGVEKITMYHYIVHPNTTKVLNYYRDSGFLEYRPMTLSMEVSNLEDYRHLEIQKNHVSAVVHQVIHYNDCFYRNMYRYKYIAIVDRDEVLMPLGNLTSWKDLVAFGENLKDKNCAKFGSFCFLCSYFPKYPEKPRYTSEIPEFFYMLQHVERVKEPLPAGFGTKCLHNTDRVIGTHNHFPFHVVPEVCNSYIFDKNVALMNHYREPYDENTLNDSVLDLSLWHFKDKIIERSTKVLEELGFFNDESNN